jgi:RND family efflux transporter MFP subunit
MMDRHPLARRSTLLLGWSLLLPLAACGTKPAADSADASGSAQIIGPDNIAVVTADTLRSGPAISGTLGADREARIRAEVSGAMIETFVEPGERVNAGTALGRIDDAAVRDAAASARSGVAQAKIAAEQSTRELQRARTLAKAGAIADRDVETAERANLGAQAALADAQARLAQAEKVLRNTTVRAPFAGIVAERAVSPGDIVSPGTALFTIIDPRSLRVEGSVPATSIGDVKLGAPVTFTVNGADRQLTGRITRVSPMVDPQTRQVRILVSVPNTAGSLVAGLFVEGRIAADKRMGTLVPEKALDITGLTPTAMRLRGGKVEKIEVQLGARDEAAERFEVVSGLAVGDTVLMGAARGISVGSIVQVSAPKDAKTAVETPSADIKKN